MIKICGIDPEIIWSVAKDDLSVLKKELILIFKELNVDKTYLSEILDSKYYIHLKYLLDLL
jgi:hypothetical protein